MKQREDTYAPALAMPGYLAHHATHVFDRLVDAALKPHGVSIALLGPLLILARRGTLLQRDLVRALGVGQPALVRILNRLEASGFIERTPNPSNRRSTPISLTPAGRNVADRGKQILHAVNHRGLRNFSADEVKELVRLLQQLIANFEAGPAPETSDVIRSD